MQAFINSPAHYRNLVDPVWTHVGVGVTHAADGRIYTTHNFMALRRRPRPPAATPAARTGGHARSDRTRAADHHDDHRPASASPGAPPHHRAGHRGPRPAAIPRGDLSEPDCLRCQPSSRRTI